MIFDLNPGDFVYPNAKVLDAYDGDTVYLDIDPGFRFRRRSRNIDDTKYREGYRLLDIDAPEIKPLITRQAGTAARDYLRTLVTGRPVIVQTLEDPDNFGRYLVHLWLLDGTDINALMVTSGHAIPYTP